MDKVDKLLDSVPEPEERPFGSYQEEAIVSLALDHPEFFTAVGRFLKPTMFGRLECQWVMAEILNCFEKYEVVPTKKLLRDKVLRSMTEDEPFEDVLEIISRKSNPREVPMIKDTLLQWARDKAFGLLYSDDAQDAYVRGEYDHLEKIVQDANRIADVGQRGFWFFDQYKVLFEPDVIDHRTTGFPSLDRYLNNGGPSPKEVVCWLAATNVGKSIVLCNNAITSLCGLGANGEPGQDVLLITFELDTIKTAMRCLGIASGMPINEAAERKETIITRIEGMKNTYRKRFAIYEWSPEECSVANIYALLDNLRRTESWSPDVIIIDYLDLMISRNDRYNSDDYTRQKHVANELRGLARNEHVLLFTATQTNRTATGGEVVDINKAAESFAKQFALDYIVSLSQTTSERRSKPLPQIRLYIAKNRNGPKLETVTCTIAYDTMIVKEAPL